MIKNATKQNTFTKFNLEIHQLVNEPNQKVILEFLQKMEADPFEKELVIDFIERLQRNSAKIRYAVEQIENKLDVGENFSF